MNHKNIDESFISVTSAQPVNIKFTYPTSIPITKEQQNRYLNVYTTSSSILKET